MSVSQLCPIEVEDWIQEYKKVNQPLLDADPEFERWLEQEYVPIAGGWQY